MKTLLLLIPFFISLLAGLFLIKLILREEIKGHWLLHFSLAWGIGLGLSGFIGYLNFLILNKYNPHFQITANLLVLGLSLMGVVLAMNKQPLLSQQAPWREALRDGLYLTLFLILFFPIYYIASFYPYGGWDSWAVWHFKSKFLYLSGDAWRNMFDPVLWRSSPHYPLLLPLINVWGWTFIKETTYYGPMITSILYALISLTLLISSLTPFKKDKIAFLGCCILISSPFFGRTAFSQYADILLGYYLLAAVICIIYSVIKSKKRFALLGGIFIGFLSFSKPEGLVAALLALVLATIYYFICQKERSLKFLAPFWAGSAMSLILPFTFYAFIAPDNLTMVNGFTSSTNPSTWLRFKTIVVYSLIELISLKKWKGLWVLLLLLILVNCKRSFIKEIILIPSLLASYGLIISAYYLMNTHFEILWWMSVSLDRILGSVLPLMLWWVIYSFRTNET